MSAESPATKQVSLTVAFDGPVATLTLQHGSMNAIDDALLDALAATVAMVEAHSGVSVLRIAVNAGSFPRERIFGWSPSDWQRCRALTR